MSKTYWEKLKDPRWQKKRLEVFEAYRYACGDCQATDKTLHVHHAIYRKGKEPWEYEPMSDLVCLCEDCHEQRTWEDLEIRESLTDGVNRELALLLPKTQHCGEDDVWFGGLLPCLTANLMWFLKCLSPVGAALRGTLTPERKEAGLRCFERTKIEGDLVCANIQQAMEKYKQRLLEFHNKEGDGGQ